VTLAANYYSEIYRINSCVSWWTCCCQSLGVQHAASLIAWTIRHA